MSQLISQLQNKSGLIFDFDGTIANTEEYHWMAYNQCLQKYKVTLDNNDISRYIGKTESNIYNLIKKDFSIDFDDSAFMKERLQTFFELIRTTGLKPYKYMYSIMDNVPEAKYFILSSQKIEVLQVLLDMWKLAIFKNSIISIANSGITKDSVLQEAEKNFGISINNLAIFEDSSNILSKAQQLGLLAIGVVNKFNENIQLQCDFVIRGVE